MAQPKNRQFAVNNTVELKSITVTSENNGTLLSRNIYR